MEIKYIVRNETSEITRIYQYGKQTVFVFPHENILVDGKLSIIDMRTGFYINNSEIMNMVTQVISELLTN